MADDWWWDELREAQREAAGQFDRSPFDAGEPFGDYSPDEEDQ